MVVRKVARKVVRGVVLHAADEILFERVSSSVISGIDGLL